MPNVKAGIVGVGHMGQYHVAAYSELLNVDLVGIADVDEVRCAEVADRYQTKSYKDYQNLFDKVQVVTIAVPTSKHYSVAKEFLESGIHVLLEKPITPSMEEARDLFAIAQKNNVVLHIGHVERFNGAVQEIKKIIKEPLLVESRRIGPFVPRIQDDGVIMDLLIHDIDIILNLVESKVKKMNAMGGSVYSDKEDFANVQIWFENGCVANLLASRVSENKIRTMSVSQKDAYIFLDYTDQNIHIHRQASSESILTREELRYKQDSFIEKIYVHKDNPLKLEIKHFVDCTLDDSKRGNSEEKELRSLDVALRVIKILKDDKVIL